MGDTRMTNILFYLLLACTGPANAHLVVNLTPEYDDSYAAELEPYTPKGLKVSYLSSVVIQISHDGVHGGSGSGNYFRLGKHRFILTAAHVVQDETEILIIEKGFHTTPAKVDLPLWPPRPRGLAHFGRPLNRDTLGYPLGQHFCVAGLLWVGSLWRRRTSPRGSLSYPSVWSAWTSTNGRAYCASIQY